MKTIATILFLGALLLSGAQANAQQVEYHYFDTIENVKIEYRWTRANLLSRSSDAVLYLQITNNNDFPVHITYDVGFYQDEQLFLESKDNVICLNPGQRRRGSRTDMRFSAPGIGMDAVEGPDFSWDIIVFHIEEKSCN